MNRPAAVLVAGLVLVTVVLDAAWFDPRTGLTAGVWLLPVLVVATARHAGPAAGATTGLLGGLLVDAAPPATGLLGATAVGLGAAGAVAAVLRLPPSPHPAGALARSAADTGTAAVCVLVALLVGGLVRAVAPEVALAVDGPRLVGALVWAGLLGLLLQPLLRSALARLDPGAAR